MRSWLDPDCFRIAALSLAHTRHSFCSNFFDCTDYSFHVCLFHQWKHACACLAFLFSKIPNIKPTKSCNNTHMCWSAHDLCLPSCCHQNWEPGSGRDESPTLVRRGTDWEKWSFWSTQLCTTELEQFKCLFAQMSEGALRQCIVNSHCTNTAPVKSF